MEYIYAVLLLHKAGKEISEENIKKVLEAAGLTPDEARVKALVSALEGKNLDEIIEEAKKSYVSAPVAVAAAPAETAQQEQKAEEKTEEEEEKKKEEEALGGLSSLFGF